MSILIDTQYKNITTNFKPEFGNEKHIAVLDLFERLKNLEDKEKTSKAIKNEIEETKKKIIRLLEK